MKICFQETCEISFRHSSALCSFEKVSRSNEMRTDTNAYVIIIGLFQFPECISHCLFHIGAISNRFHVEFLIRLVFKFMAYTNVLEINEMYRCGKVFFFCGANEYIHWFCILHGRKLWIVVILSVPILAGFQFKPCYVCGLRFSFEKMDWKLDNGYSTSTLQRMDGDSKHCRHTEIHNIYEIFNLSPEFWEAFFRTGLYERKWPWPQYISIFISKICSFCFQNKSTRWMMFCQFQLELTGWINVSVQKK